MRTVDQQRIEQNGSHGAWFYVYCKCHESLELQCNQAVELARDLYRYCLKIHGNPVVAKESFGVFGEIKEEVSTLSPKKVKRLRDAFMESTGGIFGFVRRLQKSNY